MTPLLMYSESWPQGSLKLASLLGQNLYQSYLMVKLLALMEKRRSHDASSDKKAIHMVSAWASTNSLVLGQIKTDEKSNEITAIPELLKNLELKGCLVTIDAMGCQKKIAEVIIEQEADYLLAVKENQPTLHQAIQNYFAEANQADFEGYEIDFEETFDKGHGRLESRRCWVGYDALPYLEGSPNWEALQTIVMVESERTVKEKTTIEHRYYISSTKAPQIY
ncbi:MAG: ISAs1 family transposase [Mesoflavibacter sp.]|nr:ISAs1 family transposase [Mesoflavibacter sp.]